MFIYTVTALEVATFYFTWREGGSLSPKPGLLDSTSILSGESLKKPLQLVTQLSSSLCHSRWS